MRGLQINVRFGHERANQTGSKFLELTSLALWHWSCAVQRPKDACFAFATFDARMPLQPTLNEKCSFLFQAIVCSLLVMLVVHISNHNKLVVCWCLVDPWFWYSTARSIFGQGAFRGIKCFVFIIVLVWLLLIIYGSLHVLVVVTDAVYLQMVDRFALCQFSLYWWILKSCTDDPRSAQFHSGYKGITVSFDELSLFSCTFCLGMWRSFHKLTTWWFFSLPCFACTVIWRVHGLFPFPQFAFVCIDTFRHVFRTEAL